MPFEEPPYRGDCRARLLFQGTSRRRPPEHRHRELAFCQELRVVDAILRRRHERLERVVHGVRPGVEFGVVRARLFVDGAQVGGELIPEAVEIDAFATCLLTRYGLEVWHGRRFATGRRQKIVHRRHHLGTFTDRCRDPFD
jgi:hypothetical protein